jgi:hypothetical protein
MLEDPRDLASGCAGFKQRMGTAPSDPSLSSIQPRANRRMISRSHALSTRPRPGWYLETLAAVRRFSCPTMPNLIDLPISTPSGS